MGMGRLLHSVNTAYIAISGSMLMTDFQLLNYGNVELISKYLSFSHDVRSQGNQSASLQLLNPPPSLFSLHK